ncbi:dCMP deaminase [Paenibacillus swuensis]|uniref:dCMP deaminase n=1 Tax=Paenibacillus swuensis TaxID=1178515 RepID=A0A172THJ6_9BACL|nr:nucleoside deaminase [Paenibacillus swuensis]ANE46528.1 dCMP deaminase [Paenibacillus swuensis]
MDNQYEYLLLAFEEAQKAKEEGTFPIGAVIVDSNGTVVSRGRNRVFSSCDSTSHAEVDAIRKAGHKILDVESKKFIANNGLTLYTTCEPCPMCTGTIVLSLIKKVVWAANDADIGAFKKFKEGTSQLPIYNDLFNDIEIVAAPYSDLEIRQRQMLAEWNNNRGYTDTHWNKELIYDAER